MGSVTLAGGIRLYLDANVFIHASETPNAYPQLANVFDRLDRGELTAVTSMLTLAEVLVLPLRTGNLPVAAAYRARLAGSPTLAVAAVTHDVLVRAAGIRAITSGVKLPDGIHAATALEADCDVFLTNDGRLRSIPRLPVMILADLA